MTTIVEIGRELRRQRATSPFVLEVREIARLRKRNEQTVRMWFAGTVIPPPDTREWLGKRYGKDEEELWPVIPEPKFGRRKGSKIEKV